MKRSVVVTLIVTILIAGAISYETKVIYQRSVGIYISALLERVTPAVLAEPKVFRVEKVRMSITTLFGQTHDFYVTLSNSEMSILVSFKVLGNFFSKRNGLQVGTNEIRKIQTAYGLGEENFTVAGKTFVMKFEWRYGVPFGFDKKTALKLIRAEFDKG